MTLLTRSPRLVSINQPIVIHQPLLVDADTIGLDPCSPPQPLFSGMATFEGVASDGRRCRALSAAMTRCRKDGAVAFLHDEQPIHVCGGHYRAHRRGMTLLLTSAA